MNNSLQGRFREVIHNNYTLYYFVYMPIWRMFAPGFVYYKKGALDSQQ